MEVRTSEINKKTIICVWLSKQERNDTTINDLINEMKKKHRICTFLSGTVPSEEIVRKMIIDVV